MNIITFVYVNFIVKYTNNNYSNEYKILTFSQIMSYMRKPILKIFCAFVRINDDDVGSYGL